MGAICQRAAALAARGTFPLREERRLRQAGGLWLRGSIIVDDILYGSLEGVDSAGHLCHYKKRWSD